MSEAPPQSLFAALLVGSVPLLMGSAAFFFTSGVTLRCEPNAGGHVRCIEGRRFLKAIDVPLRDHPDVIGAVAEPRQAHDEDGDAYTTHVPVLLTPGGSEELAPFGAQAGIDDLVDKVDAYAKDPQAAGLRLGGQTSIGGTFFHFFSTIFILSGLTTFYRYLSGRPWAERNDRP